jgi:hypothetical protein
LDACGDGHLKGRRQENDLRLLIRNLDAALAMPDTPRRSLAMTDAALLRDPWSWTREPITVALVIWAIFCPVLTATEFALLAALGVGHVSNRVVLLVAIVLPPAQAALAGRIAHRPARRIALLAGLAVASTLVITIAFLLIFAATFQPD